MEPPPGIAFAHELEWTCKEPALVIWKESGRQEISSLGLPCPNGKPTLLTLWIGKNASQEVHLMLQLRITLRISKRRKILDHYLLPQSSTCATASTSIVHLKDASENIRPYLEEAYGKFSTQKCLHLPFIQPKPSRVLMPIAPDNASCLGGTALHLLTLLHSLSCASSFEIYVSHSTYAQHALANIEGVLADSASIDLLQSYAGIGGVFDNWRQIGVEQPKDYSKAQNLSVELKNAESNHVKAKDTFPESCIPEDKSTHVQPLCSPPPYSPLTKTAKLPETPEKTGVLNELSDPIHTAGCLKRSHSSLEPDAGVPPKKFAKSLISCSPTCNDTSDVAHDTEISSSLAHDTEAPSSLEQRGYSPTIANTPSTVEDPHTVYSRHHTPNYIETTLVEDDPFTGHLSNANKTTSPSLLSTPGRSDTLDIKPTVFTNGDELPRYSIDADKVSTRARVQDSKKAKSFMSATSSLDMVSPKPTMRSLKKELRMLVSAKVPLLTEQALQRIIDDILESLDHTQKVAEIGLQETLDDLKVELQLEKDKGVDEMNDHAESVLIEVKSQLEDLANGHLIAFEDMLLKTGKQLKQTLKVFLLVLAKAVATGRLDDNDQAANTNESNVTESREQHPSTMSTSQQPKVMLPIVADSPAVAATKLFLHESRDLCASAKVKVLDRLASQNTAEIFLTIDKELREAWVASWIGQDSC